MRLGIVGSRSFPRLDLVVAYVESLPKGTVVVSGGAIGVDLIAQTTAKECGLEVFPCDPDPDRGIAGLFERNTRIVQVSDVLVAFITHCRKCPPGRCRRGGWTHGTSDTVEKAQRVGKFGWGVWL